MATYGAGWRVIGGVRKFYRSRWEANYARFLQWQRERGDVASWAHEPETFWFAGVKRGVLSYLPDFRVHYPDGRVEYHEVKGWMTPRSKTALRRMAKHHPSITMRVVAADAYARIETGLGCVIQGWEHSGKPGVHTLSTPPRDKRWTALLARMRPRRA